MNGTIGEMLGRASEQSDDEFFATPTDQPKSAPRLVTGRSAGPTLTSVLLHLERMTARAENLGVDLETSAHNLLGPSSVGLKDEARGERNGFLPQLVQLAERLDRALTHISVESNRINSGLNSKPSDVLG